MKQKLSSQVDNVYPGFMQVDKDERKSSPDSGLTPKKKMAKTGSFVLGEANMKLNFNEISFSPMNQPKAFMKGLGFGKDKEPQNNQDFEFSGVGGFFIASDIIYTQNERQTVYYLSDNETIQSETVSFDNFVKMNSCKLLVTDNLKIIGASLMMEAIDKITGTFRKRTATLSKKDKKDTREKAGEKEPLQDEDIDDEEYFNQKTNCRLHSSRL